jgi:metacaspase-1
VTAISLHIGLNKVDPAHYDGWDGALNACEFDANDMETLAQGLGYTTKKLLTTEATAETILAALEAAASELSAGDIFFCSYSGHGGQVPNLNDDGDETDHSDETWLAYDRQIVDDELYDRWRMFAAGVRIVLLSDSCHSGSVNRAMEDEEPVPDPVETRQKAAEQSPRYRAMPLDVMSATYRSHEQQYKEIQTSATGSGGAEPAATVLLISGCQDDQLSLDGIANGLFTENLRAVWDDGAWSGGGYPEFRQAIVDRMPADQTPQFTPVGADNQQFVQQKPFTV